MTVEKGYDKMKKRLLALLSVLCVASALAACSQEPAQSEVQSGVSVGSVESDAASQAPDVSEVSGTGETSAENSGGTTGPSGATQGPGGKTHHGQNHHAGRQRAFRERGSLERQVPGRQAQADYLVQHEQRRRKDGQGF